MKKKRKGTCPECKQTLQTLRVAKPEETLFLCEECIGDMQ